MPGTTSSPARIFYYVKVLVIIFAIGLLLYNSEQKYTNLLLIIVLTCAGYFLGKITCSLHYKNTSLAFTLLVFILMNLVHSFIDGISFTRQSFVYWFSAVSAHEAIRQPTLYVVLWALLQPIKSSLWTKGMICFLSVSVGWVIGSWLGKITGTSVSQFLQLREWLGYSIFLFIGDITHHLIDQYKSLKSPGIYTNK